MTFFLHKKDMVMYSAHKELKYVAVERFTKTLKSYLFVYDT